MTLLPIFLPKEFIEPPPLHSEHYAWRYWWAFSRWTDHKMNIYIKMGFIRLVYTRAELFNNGPLTAWLLIGPENQISLQFQWRLGGFLESHESLVHIRKLKKHALLDWSRSVCNGTDGLTPIREQKPMARHPCCLLGRSPFIWAPLEDAVHTLGDSSPSGDPLEMPLQSPRVPSFCWFQFHTTLAMTCSRHYKMSSLNLSVTVPSVSPS